MCMYMCMCVCGGGGVESGGVGMGVFGWVGGCLFVFVVLLAQ